MPYDEGQQTPVIIKNGGDYLPVPSEQVIIRSDFMYFTEWVQRENTWESQSTLTGRLHELSILEESERVPKDTLQPFPDELSSVRIECERDQFLGVREAGDTASGDVVLVIESSVPFNVEKPGDWKYAAAMFPPITGIVMKGGNEKLVERKFDNSIVTFGVHFHRNKK